jgi:hypothetical protein
MGTIFGLRRSHCFAWASVAVLLFAAQVNPFQRVEPESTRLVAKAALGGSDAVLIGLHAKAAPAEREVGLGLPGPVLAAAFAAPIADVPPVEPGAKLGVVKRSDDCAADQACIDQYLWSVYERARKVDSRKVAERKKVTVTKKGKKRTVTKTVTKLVDEDFTWKDPKAAEKAGMTVAEYVIGGMDPSFRLKLYHLLRALDDAGLEPGITSAFRDDYRQSIATGLKAATDRSYHGGSSRGGYGHGLAADLVSTKGATRAERWVSSGILWKWVDDNGMQFGIGRPYLHKDPPHVAPIDGREYAQHRGLSKRAGLETK